jgi:hypothetical protein
MFQNLYIYYSPGWQMPATLGACAKYNQYGTIDWPNLTAAPCTNGQGGIYFPNWGKAQLTSEIPQYATGPNSNVGLMLQGHYASPTGLNYFTGTLPLSSFATASSVTALQNQVATLSASVTAFQSQVQTYMQANTQALARLNRGVAMAASLSSAEPAPGTNNRLAVGTATYGASNSVSVNYTHREGRIDMSAAASFAGRDSLARASIGLSW